MKIEKNIRYKSGIYQIINKVNRKSYIGSSIDLYNRLHTYLCLNKTGRIHNKHLQNAFNKYGIDKFDIKILEILDCENLSKDKIRILLKDREQHWMDYISPEYNKRRLVDLNYQISPTISTRERISLSMKKAIAEGKRVIKRVQIHSIKVSLFTLNGILIKRFNSIGLLREYIGSKNRTLNRYAKKDHKYKNYLIYLTSEENKVKPYSELKKERYANRRPRDKKDKTVRSSK